MAKRAATEPRAKDKEQPVSEDELEATLEQFRQKIASDNKEALEAAMAKQQESTFTHVAQLVKTVQATQNKRFENLENEVAGIKGSQVQIEKEHKEMFERIKEMEKILALAEKETIDLASLEDDTFNRDPITNKLKLGATGEMHKATVMEHVTKWMDEVDIPNDAWKLAGPAKSKQFGLFFDSPHGAGARHARKSHLALKNVDGSWREVFLQSVAGPDVKLYSGPDKPPKQVCEEIMGKKLKGILEELYPDRTWTLRKYAGENRRESYVLGDGHEVIKCHAVSRNDLAPLWDNARLAELRVDKAAVLQRFRMPGSSGAAASIQWSSS